MDFRKVIENSRVEYEELANGIIDQEMKWDSFFEGVGGFNANTVEAHEKIKKAKAEIQAEMKKGFLSQIEENMGVMFPKLLKEFDELKVKKMFLTGRLLSLKKSEKI